MMTPVLLSNNRIALVDDIDADLVRGVNWSLSQDYLVRTAYIGKKGVGIKLHRLVLERKLGRPIKKGMVTDHINGNRCDNRRENLREATYWENSISGLTLAGRAKNSSKYKGVVRDTNPKIKIKKWKAILYHERKAIYLGNYETPEQAALAYNEGAIKYKGKLARLNPVPPSPAIIEFAQKVSLGIENGHN